MSRQTSQCFVTPIEMWWALGLCHQFDLLLLMSTTQCPAIDQNSEQMQTNLKPHYGNNQSDWEQIDNLKRSSLLLSAHCWCV